VLIAIGYEVPIELPVDGLLQEILPITLFPHLPLLINGIRTVRHRRGAVTIGTALSLVFCGILVVTLAGGPGPFSIYRGNVLAHYIAHIAYLTFALAQLGFHLAALPAAWHQRQNPR